MAVANKMGRYEAFVILILRFHRSYFWEPLEQIQRLWQLPVDSFDWLHEIYSLIESHRPPSVRSSRPGQLIQGHRRDECTPYPVTSSTRK